MQHAVRSERTIGAVAGDNGTAFGVWAPGSARVEVVLDGGVAHELEPVGEGWFEGRLADVQAGTRYRLRLNGADVHPDPLSRYQPEGVHGPSQVVNPSAFRWTDQDWRGRPLEDLVIYELHVGTATPEGTFDSLIERLPYFAELGVTAIELMPVAEFPGTRNWGYDGVYLFAPSRAYGGPVGLRRLVDAAHRHGLAVILDVVYNHFGPEGNYLPAISDGRIFTDRHETPWGSAVNYDDDGSDAVRAIVLENVRQWIHEYHIDGLRLDATHAIMDASDTHILMEIAQTARGVDRHVVVIAEDERNERMLLLTAEEEGYGIDAVWADDVHHTLRRLTAGDSEGYYSAYEGTTDELALALKHGWLYQGETYAPSGEARGTSAKGIQPQRFIHCIQNHDQVGNRALGERLHHQVDLDTYRAASVLLLATPYTPLLWMGQEWAATTPFLYFTDHPDELGRLVTNGRREEFKGFPEFADDSRRANIPDPQLPETFERSRLQWQEMLVPEHAAVLRLYREMLRLRREHPALRQRARESWDVRALSDGAIAMRREAGDGSQLLVVVNLRGALELDLACEPLAGGVEDMEWRVLLSSDDRQFGGDGTAVTVGEGLLTLSGPVAIVLESAV